MSNKFNDQDFKFFKDNNWTIYDEPGYYEPGYYEWATKIFKVGNTDVRLGVGSNNEWEIGYLYDGFFINYNDNNAKTVAEAIRAGFREIERITEQLIEIEETKARLSRLLQRLAHPQ